MARAGQRAQHLHTSIRNAFLSFLTPLHRPTHLLLLAVACTLPAQAVAQNFSTKRAADLERPPLQILQDVILCRASSSSSYHIRQGFIDGLDDLNGNPRYANWRGTPRSDGSGLEIELPAEISVFGMNTRKVLLNYASFWAILEGTSLDDVIHRGGLKHRAGLYDTHDIVGTRPVALRTMSTGIANVRSIVARTMDNSGNVYVGCGDVSESRPRAGESDDLDTSADYHSNAGRLKIIGDYLSCRLERADAADSAVALVRNYHRVPPATRWSGRAIKDTSEWLLPEPIMVDGISVSRIWLSGEHAYGVVEATPSSALAGRWAMTATESDAVEALFVRRLDDRVAPDGWIEERERIAFQWGQGITLTGCRYGQSYPAYGWWPEWDENREDD